MTGALPIWPEWYVGLPFGDGPGEVTCWGLVCRVYDDCLGQQLPAYGEISASDLIAVARAMRAGSEIDSDWRQVAAPQTFDVALMRGACGGKSVVHVGLHAGGNRLLHAERASGTVLVPLDHWSVCGRILGWRRRACR